MIRILLGAFSSDLTNHCIDELSKLDRNEKAFLIVPEQASMQAEKLLTKKLGGIMSIQVLSFQRLAFHVFSETGGAGKKILGETGKAMVLRKALFELRKDLKYYHRETDKAGFIDEMLKLISEFSKFGITPFILQTAAVSCSVPDALKLRLSDYCLICSKFYELMSESYISSDDVLDILAEKLPNSGFLHDSRIWIDGFSGFTPQEYRVIDSLLKVNHSFSVTVQLPKFVLDTNCADAEAFIEPFMTFHKLKELLADKKLESKVIELPETATRPRAVSDVIQAIGFSRNISSSKSDGFSVFCAENIYSDIETCAGAIKKLVRGGYRFKDIAVVLCNSESYAPKLKTTFGSCGIPIFIDKKNELSSSSLSRFVSALLEIIYYNWSYDSVFKLLKSGFCNIGSSEIDRLENYVLEFGISGGRWFSVIENGPEAARAAVVEFITAFTKQFNRYSKYQINIIVEKLNAYLMFIKAPERLECLSMRQKKSGNHEAAQFLRQIWPKTAEVLEKAAEILGDQKVSILEFMKLVNSGISSVKLAIAPPVSDCVLVADFTRSVIPNVKQLFVLGMNSGSFPEPAKSAGLLNDLDREKLLDADLKLKQGGFLSNYENIRLFLNVISKAENSLTITYCKSDFKGKQLYKSFLLDDIIEVLDSGDFKERSITDLGYDDYALEKCTALSLLAACEEGSESDIEINNILSRFNEFDEPLRILKLIKKRKIGSEKLLTSPLQLSGGQKRLKTSVTRLERYYACPFSYFAQYVVKASERKIADLKPIDIGNYFHKIFDSFSKSLEKERNLKNQTIHEIDDHTVKSIAADCIDGVLIASSDFRTEAHEIYLKQRIKAATMISIEAIFNHLKAGSFETLFTELDFSDSRNFSELDSDEAPFSLSALIRQLQDGTRLIIEGKIDRIDILKLNGEDYVKILDYKSGSKTFDLMEAYYGLNLQLLIYMYVFLSKYYKKSKNLSETKLAHPAAVLYFLVKNPTINADKVKSDSIKDAIIENFKMEGGIILENRDVINSLDDALKTENKSNIIPISFNKDGGYKFSKNMNEEDFNAILEFAVEKAEKAAEGIASGDIAVKPFKSKKSSGCEFCSYKSICKFDTGHDGNSFNELKALSKDEILNRLRERE